MIYFQYYFPTFWFWVSKDNKYKYVNCKRSCPIISFLCSGISAKAYSICALWIKKPYFLSSQSHVQYFQLNLYKYGNGMDDIKK